MTPRARSERLVYEPLDARHAPGLFVALGDPRVWEHLPGVRVAQSVEELAARYSRVAAGAPPEAPGETWVNYAVALGEEPGVPIGRVEATLHARDGGPWAETAYLFNPAHWGRGLATEAMRWFHAELASRGVRELWVCITPSNARSLALARRLGYRDAPMGDVARFGSYDPGDTCLRLDLPAPGEASMSLTDSNGATLELVRPHGRWRESYRGLVAEFRDAGEKPVPFVVGYPCDDFDAFLELMAAQSRGEQVEGFVPHSTFWLVRGGSEVAGVSNMRHRLTDGLRREGGHVGYGVRPSARGAGCATAILALTLRRAAEDLGLSEVLLTCAKENVASARTIAKNGGVLEGEELIPSRGEIVQRWWIRIG